MLIMHIGIFLGISAVCFMFLFIIKTNNQQFTDFVGNFSLLNKIMFILFFVNLLLGILFISYLDTTFKTSVDKNNYEDIVIY